MITSQEAIMVLRTLEEKMHVSVCGEIAELIEFLSQAIKQQNMDIAKLQEDLINVIAKRTDGENK